MSIRHPPTHTKQTRSGDKEICAFTNRNSAYTEQFKIPGFTSRATTCGSRKYTHVYGYTAYGGAHIHFWDAICYRQNNEPRGKNWSYFQHVCQRVSITLSYTKAPPENLTVAQLSLQVPATGRIQYTPYSPMRSILIPSSYLYLSSMSLLTITSDTYNSCPVRATCPFHPIFSLYLVSITQLGYQETNCAMWHRVVG